jgi:serine/threonine protein kinase
VAALNHPHIVSIFDFGEVNGNPYAVSELIEGQSLRALLRRGPVPTRKLIDIGVQIAEGLAAAHAADIAHRDLKPENIMISGDGRIKILDFGLARSASRTSEALNGNGATVTVGVTQPGTILGTPNYMSPEQARGEVADYRSDQFSFASDFRIYLVSNMVTPLHAPARLRRISRDHFNPQFLQSAFYLRRPARIHSLDALRRDKEMTGVIAV